MFPIRVGAFELDPRSRELREGATRIRLQGQPFEILRALLERPGDVVTRTELRHRLWPDGVFVDFEHSLNTAVKRLRAALGDDADRPTFVETVPRCGYRYIAAGRTPGKPSRLRLVVLPFSPVGGGVQSEHFSNRLTAEVVVQLGAACPDVECIALGPSSFDWPGPKRARDIGESLHAAFLLEGSTRHHEDRVRITARLIETATEVHRWSGIYSRVVDCPMSVEADVAGSVARAITNELSPEWNR
jgi:DNA-binding winged helix-turn-helix (wHTH) protein